MKTSVFVYNTITANGADLANLNGVISLGNSTTGYITPIYQSEIIPNGYVQKTYNAGTALVLSANIASVVSGTTYAVVINGVAYKTVATSTSTEQTVIEAIASAVNNDSLCPATMAWVSTEGVITGKALTPLYNYGYQNVTLAVTTAGVAQVGTYAELTSTYGNFFTEPSGATGYDYICITYNSDKKDTGAGFTNDLGLNQLLIVIPTGTANSSAFIAKANSQFQNYGPVVYDNIIATVNSTTSLASVYTRSILAGTFIRNGFLLEAFFGFQLLSTGAKQISASFGGTTVFDSTSIASAWDGTSTALLVLRIIRVSNTVVRCFASISAPTAIAPTYTEITGLDLDATAYDLVVNALSATASRVNLVEGKVTILQS